VRRSFTEGGPPKAYKLQLAGQPRDALRLLAQVEIVSEKTIRLDALKVNNESRSPHTAKSRPWLLIAYFAFAEEKTAIAFERYLKSGSGRAFINRHFV